ncbi:stress response protein NST1-like [Chenopodium quinoa]|uniref:stress response protein NST1-like n=1 Tax=Chenopodium quinoa TaxID=63459 RepID=UPI000B774A32|nr:stress response protein NST1-like [Chenopodium quinoa]
MSSWSEKENIHFMSQKPSNFHNLGAALSDCAILVKETDQSVPSLPSKEDVLTPQVDCRKDKASLGRIDMSSTYKHQRSSKSDVSSGRVSGGLVNDQNLVDSDTFLPEASSSGLYLTADCAIKEFEKRDVKVKALQAAEAAKRAAEIKENERNQKKEAMNLERARVEQKNMKEMELKRKLKEEQRKKREAGNAAKKRQREEEEKKEKERRKHRIEEARLQHKQEERAHQRKHFIEKSEKQLDIGYEGEDSEKPVNDLVVGSDRREAEVGLSTLIDHKMSTGSSAAGKVGAVDVAENLTPNVDKKDKPTHRTSAPQS